MADKNHFLTVKDLMKLTGSDSYQATWKTHQTIRDSIGENKRKLLIREYCEYEQIDFKYVWSVLRE